MLRLWELRKVYRLIDACLQAGAHPDGWRRVLAEGARGLFAAQVAIAGEFLDVWDPDQARILHALDLGWETEAQHAHFIAYEITGANRSDPARALLFRRRGPFVVASIGQMMDLEAYRRAEVVRRHMVPSGLLDQLIAISQIGDGTGRRWNILTCLRRIDDPPFSARDRRLMRVLALELAPLVGGRLPDSTDPVLGLTLRMQEALRLLLEGASEPAAATAMGVSPRTFHKYVTQLYRTFSVHTRAELQARFAGRGRLLREPELEGDPRKGRIRREGAPMTQPWRAARTFGVDLR